MSRSYKKNPVIKDRGFFKNEHNKRYRRVCRSVAKQLKYKEDLLFPLFRSVVNDYDICDYKLSPLLWGELSKATKEDLFFYKRK